MPPTGGYGGNVGVQDAHNLAWKLAHVVRGDAGPRLLSTYDPERRPIAQEIVEQAYARYVLRLAPELGKEDLHPMADDAAIDLGYRYRSDAVVSDGSGADGLFADPREPSAEPGVRAPHVALEGGSTIDLFGRRFVLVTADEAWQRAGNGLVETQLIQEPGFSEVYGPGAVLVRPDGHVGWRSDDAADEGALTSALTRLLARE